MGVRATCPHCGGVTSRVRAEMRCTCGWADPEVHRPYHPVPNLDKWTADELREALTLYPERILDDISEQLSKPPISIYDGDPVLFTEPYKLQPGDFQ